MIQRSLQYILSFVLFALLGFVGSSQDALASHLRDYANSTVYQNPSGCNTSHCVFKDLWTKGGSTGATNFPFLEGTLTFDLFADQYGIRNSAGQSPSFTGPVSFTVPISASGELSGTVGKTYDTPSIIFNGNGTVTATTAGLVSCVSYHGGSCSSSDLSNYSKPINGQWSDSWKAFSVATGQQITSVSCSTDSTGAKANCSAQSGVVGQVRLELSRTLSNFIWAFENTPTFKTGWTSWAGRPQVSAFPATLKSNATVNFVAPVTPVVDIKANNSDGPISITSGTSANLSWTTTNAISCQASNGFSGAKGTSATSLSTGSLTSAKTYTLACTSSSGASASDSVTVNVSTPTPTVDLKANGSDSVSISYNAAATLTWTSSNANSCTASNAWSGAKALSNSSGESTGSLTSTRTYTLTCTGAGGSNSDSVTVTVGSAQVPAPTVDLKANGSDSVSVSYNTGATLSWTSANATSCSASNSWSGNKATSGSEATGNLTSTRAYTLTCTGTGGTGSDSVTVTVGSAQVPAPAVDLKVNSSDGPVSIPSNSAATLSWTSSNATSCTASNGWSGSKATSGSESTNNITTAKTYTLTCTNASGSASDSVTVNMNTAAGNPTVDIKANNSDGPISITSGTSATLSWTTTNAQSCWATGEWTGWKNVPSGSEPTGNITVSKTYYLQCYNTAGVVSQLDSVTVNITAPATPTPTAAPGNPAVDLKVAIPGETQTDGPVTVLPGGGVMLSWTTVNAQSCWATGGWSGWKNVQPWAEYVGNITTSTTYWLQCYNTAGVVSPLDSVTVNVGIPATPPPTGDATVDLKVSAGGSAPTNGPITIPSGTSATLSWTSTNTRPTNACWATGGWNGIGAPEYGLWKAANNTSPGESTGNLTSSRTYYLQCYNSAGVVKYLDSVTVNISASGGPFNPGGFTETR